MHKHTKSLFYSRSITPSLLMMGGGGRDSKRAKQCQMCIQSTLYYHTLADRTISQSKHITFNTTISHFIHITFDSTMHRLDCSRGQSTVLRPPKVVCVYKGDFKTKPELRYFFNLYFRTTQPVLAIVNGRFKR